MEARKKPKLYSPAAFMRSRIDVMGRLHNAIIKEIEGRKVAPHEALIVIEEIKSRLIESFQSMIQKEL